MLDLDLGRRNVQQKTRDNSFNARNEDRSLPGEATQEDILKAMEMKRGKTETMEIVLNGPRKTCVREEIRATSSATERKKEKGQEEEQLRGTYQENKDTFFQNNDCYRSHLLDRNQP